MNKWTLKRFFALALAAMMILTVPEVSAAVVLDAEVEDVVIESTETNDVVEEETTEEEEVVVESIKTEIFNIDNKEATINGQKVVALSGEIYDMGEVETSGYSMSFFTDSTYPSLKDGNYVDWIDRINIPEYGMEFYEILEECSDGDGETDYLIFDEYYSNAAGTENLIDVTYTDGTRDCYNAVPAAIITGAHDMNETLAVLAAVYQAFDRDHSEVFWLSGSYQLGCVVGQQEDGTIAYYYFFITKDHLEGFDIRLEEYQSDENISNAIVEMVEVINEILAGLDENASDVDKIRHFNDWLTKNNEYCTVDTTSVSGYPKTSYECVSAFLDEYHIGDKGPVCEGYARAFKILCNFAGIPCVLVDGDAGEPHMWNNVQVDGVWYAVDVTWDDPVGGDAGAVSGVENEYWLLVGSDTLYTYTDGSSETFADCHKVQNTVVTGGIAFTNGPVLSKKGYFELDFTPSITNQTTTYGYGSGTTPTVTVTGDADVVSKVTYQWFQYYLDANNNLATVEIAGATSATMPSGLDAGVYAIQLYYDNEPELYYIVTVNKKELTPGISGSTTKTYDGTNTVGTGLTITLDGVLTDDADKVTATADFVYADANAGTSKTINATKITITGDKAYNYKLTSTTATANVGTISPKDISGATVTLNKDKLTYNGMNQTVTATVELGGATLVADTDYTVSGNTAKDVKDSAYTVTVTGKGNYTGTATATYTISYLDANVTVKYNNETTVANWYNNAVTITADGYTISDTLDGTYSASYLVEAEGSNSGLKLYFKNAEGYITDAKDIEAINIDKTAPTDLTITVKENPFKKLLDTITFGIFNISTQDVTISATDTGSLVKDYYIFVDKSGSTTVKTATQLASEEFKKFSTLSLDAEGKYVIYAYAEDNAGNKSGYVCTDGIVIDTTDPVITNVVEPTVLNGNLKDTSATITFTASEAGTYTYYVGKTSENSVTPYENNTMVSGNNSFIVNNLDANTEYTVRIVGIDAAGNQSAETIMVFTTQKTLPTITANPTINGTYGQAVKDMTVTGGIASVEGTWAISTEATDVPEVGTTNKYVVIFTPADTNTYGSVSVEVVPTVAKKAVTVRIDDATKTFGTDNPTFTYTADGLVGNEATDVLGLVLTTTATKTSDVDTYPITATANAKNYNVTVVNGTLTITKAAAPTINPITKEYVYGLGSEGDVYISLGNLLPADNGGAIYSATKVDDKAIIDKLSCGENEVLYSVKNTGSNGDTATITVTATSKNYEDITITINITLVDKLSVSAQGIVTTVGSLTYGDALSKLTFGIATFVDTEGNVVAGTITWDTPDAKLNAGTHEVAWTFTPSNTGKYKVATGTVSVTVAKATPEVVTPTVDAIIYNPSKKLADINLPTAINGTWSWKDSSVVPTVGNEGYVAVFTPNDAANYNTVEKTVLVEVEKATPVVSVAPTASDIEYLNTLADSFISGGKVVYADGSSVEVTGTWTWKDATIAPVVADSNTTEYEVVFTPADTSNYNTVSTKITLVVAKAAIPANAPATEMKVEEETVSDIVLPEDWEWDEEDAEQSVERGSEVTATAIYTADDAVNYETTEVVIKITLIEPEIYGEDGKAGWDVIEDEIENTQDDEVKVDMNGTTKVDRQTLETLKEKDKTMVVVFTDEDGKEEYSWTIKGSDVEDGEFKNVKMDVEMTDDNKPAIPETLVNEAIANAKDHKFLSLSHDGEFGFKATLTINVGKENAGKLATLYYYNEETGKLLETENIKVEVDAEGNISLVFEHASDYVLSINDKVTESLPGGDDSAPTPGPTTPDTGDGVFGNIYFYITLLLAGGLAGYVGVRKKREE